MSVLPVWLIACVPHNRGEWVPSAMGGSLPLPAILLAAGAHRAHFPFVVAVMWVFGEGFLLHDVSLYHCAVELGDSKAV